MAQLLDMASEVKWGPILALIGIRVSGDLLLTPISYGSFVWPLLPLQRLCGAGNLIV